MRAQSFDAVVVGGGIIGLNTALVLGDAGYRVALLEAQACGQEASWAGGGIMMPLYPWRYPLALLPLLLRSVAATESLTTRLIEATGIDPELSRCGMWVRELSEVEASKAQWWARQAGWVIELSSATMPGYFDAWLPSASNIRNPRLIKALVALLLIHSGVTLIEHSPVLALKPESQGWRLETRDAAFLTPTVVCTAGAWSGALLKSCDVGFGTVRPALGQMLLLQDEAYRDQSMLLRGGLYLVPRKDGHLLAGSTVAYNGFRKILCASSYQALTAFAASVLGTSALLNVKAYWAGLRPDAGRDLPLIGEHPQHKGLWVNSGHFRNGLVLAAGSALHLADVMATSGQNPYALPPLDTAVESA